MEIIQQLGDGFEYVIGWIPLLTIAFGVAFGIFVGAMPGLSPPMGVALLVPFTYAMPAELAIILLAAVYLAADYGGSITAVTINAPGTPAAAVTAYDGYALTKKGQPGVGLGMSLVASTVGGLIGTVVLIFFSVPLAKIAASFQPAEYFAIAVFGLTSVASVGGKNWSKAILMVLLGLLLNTVGIDPISGVSRFTFGVAELYNGFLLIPALIGLFAISEVLIQIDRGQLSSQVIDVKNTKWPSVRDYFATSPTILISSLIGTLIVAPAPGKTPIASFVSYDVAKRSSRHPEQFGQGCAEGVAAAEAANSSSVGGALVPLLTLGIPGSASTAVLIGALMIHDVVPGPRMFEKSPGIVYGLFASLLVANAMLLIMGIFGSRLWIRVCSVPKRILFPLIIAISFVGSFAIRNSMFDVLCCFAFGIFGWALRRQSFPVVPIVLGMVLGDVVEMNFRQAVLIGGGYNTFVTRPVCLGILCLASLSIIVPIFAKKKTPQ